MTKSSRFSAAPRLGALVIAASTTFGCRDPQAPDPAPVVWVGDYLEFATNDPTLSCEGTPEYLDAFVGGVLDEMGLELGAPVRYYLLSEDELDALAFCPPGTRCVAGERAYTDAGLDTHEALHSTRNSGLGVRAADGALPGVTFFEEGLAVVYQNNGEAPTDPRKDVYAGLQSVPDLQAYLPVEHYGVAGDFSRFLVLEYGFSALLDFIEQQRGIGTVEEIEALFATHFDAQLSDVVTRYQEDYPSCSSFARTRHVVECSQPPIVFDGERIDLSFDISCDNPDVVGPAGGVMWQSFTLEVTNRVLVLLEPASPNVDPACQDDVTVVEVVDCDTGCRSTVDTRGPLQDAPWDSDMWGDDIIIDAGLEPGHRFVFRVSRPVDSPGRSCVGVELFANLPPAPGE